MLLLVESQPFRQQQIGWQIGGNYPQNTAEPGLVFPDRFLQLTLHRKQPFGVAGQHLTRIGQ
ncbi:hypothetical protein D3C73_1441590 [compost metagenome]